MVLEFTDHQYVDIDKIQALRWIKQGGVEVGIVALAGDKIVITEREQFDAIETAYVWKNKSYMVDDKMKKIRFVKRGEDDVK